MGADPTGMNDANEPPELPPFVPPRPDLAAARTSEHALGGDFYRRPRTSRLALVAVLAVAVAFVSSVALAPVFQAWDAAHHNHDFSFMAVQGGHPIRWNPCEPIHYVVNLGPAPPGSLQDVQDAVLRVGAATGIAFVYDGLTDEVPSRTRDPYQPALYGDEWAPVLIGWVDPRTSSFNFDPGGHEAAAVAGPLTPDTGPADIYVSGVVAVNAADPNPPGFAEPGDQGPVLLHELAHVIGLGHTKAKGELMEPSGGGVTDFGPGDLEGLKELGRSAGCLTIPAVPSG